MKTRIALFLLMVLILLAGAVRVAAQDKSSITVKGSQSTNGVVVVDVTKGTKKIELQCNQGAPFCAWLKSGKYLMVELPANRGMYDCHDVQVFADSAESTEPEYRIGEYCLVTN